MSYLARAEGLLNMYTFELFEYKAKTENMALINRSELADFLKSKLNHRNICKIFSYFKLRKIMQKSLKRIEMN